MDNVWSKDRNIGKYMYLVGKYKNKRNNCKLGSTVNKMKKHFTSLRSACRQTNMHWSQFHGCTNLNRIKSQKEKIPLQRKLQRSHIKSICDFYKSDDCSFPLSDKKYTGKRFMKQSLSKNCKMYNLLPTTTRKISASTFRKYKPRYVKLQGKIPLRQSCEVCQNFDFIVSHGFEIFGWSS